MWFENRLSFLGNKQRKLSCDLSQLICWLDASMESRDQNLLWKHEMMRFLTHFVSYNIHYSIV